MEQIKCIFISFFLFLIFFIPSNSWASGSSPPSVPPSSSNQNIHQYHLGKKIFAGKINLEKKSSVSQKHQLEILKRLEKKLPNRAKSKSQLPSLAGKLSPKQLNALQYYLKIRFKVKLERTP